jgi:hypothetical protein
MTSTSRDRVAALEVLFDELMRATSRDVRAPQARATETTLGAGAANAESSGVRCPTIGAPTKT